MGDHPPKFIIQKRLMLLARPLGFEPKTLCLEGRCSIQLSYGRSQRNISGWLAAAQARCTRGLSVLHFFLARRSRFASKCFMPDWMTLVISGTSEGIS